MAPDFGTPFPWANAFAACPPLFPVAILRLLRATLPDRDVDRTTCHRGWLLRDASCFIGSQLNASHPPQPASFDFNVPQSGVPFHFRIHLPQLHANAGGPRRFALLLPHVGLWIVFGNSLSNDGCSTFRSNPRLESISSIYVKQYCFEPELICPDRS